MFSFKLTTSKMGSNFFSTFFLGSLLFVLANGQAVTDLTRRWTNGIVPYVIDSRYSKSSFKNNNYYNQVTIFIIETQVQQRRQQSCPESMITLNTRALN